MTMFVLDQQTVASIETLSKTRAEMTLLFGEHASSPGFANDIGKVREQVESALNGRDALVTENVEKYIESKSINAFTRDFFEFYNIDIFCTYYLVKITGSICGYIDENRITIYINKNDDDIPHINIDIKTAEGVRLQNYDRRLLISVPNLPEVVKESIEGKIKDNSSLKDLISHPFLDRWDIRVSIIEDMELMHIHTYPI